MHFPSFSLILSGVFISYVCYSLYTVSLLFTPPPCTSKEHCLKSLLKEQPKMQLNLYISTMKSPLQNEVTKVYTNLDFDYTHEKEIPLTIEVPRKTKRNGTLFLHVLLSPQNFNPEGLYYTFRKDYSTVYIIIKMTEYNVPEAKTLNLLGNGEKKKNKPEERVQNLPVTHMKSKITFTIMTDDIGLPLYNIPIELTNNIKITKDFKYLPIMNYNFLYTRHKNLLEITPDVDSTNITVFYTPISIGKLRLFLHFEAAMQNFKQLGFTDKDIDEVKSIFADTNLYVLAGTVFISAMHLLFNFLAFKNDINFWKSKNNLVGISMQTALWHAFSQTVIFLHLLDGGSSLLVVIPVGIGTIIEFWKIKKILKVEIIWNENFFPKIRFNLNSKCTIAETKTRELGAQCMRQLSYLLYPLVLLGAIYSLIYLPHKSWYSWCIHSLVNGVYAFGFLFMLPQLFINYKLKSVAHLPWRSFMYKALNTFIDDVFAFIITMPVAHRVACFRDDVVFLIYLYQRWLYPVDNRIMDEDSSVLDTDLHKKEN